jgi:hypothetical protein
MKPLDYLFEDVMFRNLLDGHDIDLRPLSQWSYTDLMYLRVCLSEELPKRLEYDCDEQAVL